MLFFTDSFKFNFYLIIFKGTGFQLRLSFLNYSSSHKFDNPLNDSLPLSCSQKYLSDNKILVLTKDTVQFCCEMKQYSALVSGAWVEDRIRFRFPYLKTTTYTASPVFNSFHLCP